VFACVYRQVKKKKREGYLVGVQYEDKLIFETSLYEVPSKASFLLCSSSLNANMLALRVTPYILDDRFPTFLPLSRIQLLGYNPKELYSLMEQEW
jgi:hypothetical protein